MKNVEGVFKVRRAPLAAKHILLVDDTFTTSVRDDHVIMTCDKYGIAMAFTGVRLFHH